MAKRAANASTPNTENVTVARRYVTEREVERLMNTARKHSRHGHRDSTIHSHRLSPWTASFRSLRPAMASDRA
jgi:hypothetical protein